METKRKPTSQDKNAVDIKHDNVRLALKVFSRTVLSAVLCLFVYMALSALVVGMNTERIGYRIYETDENGNRTVVSEVYYADEEASAAESGSSETESETTEATETLPSNQSIEVIMSEVPQSMSIFLDVISSVIMLLLLSAFPYTILWSQGDHDKNSVNFGHMAEDKLRGLKIGLMASIPALAGYIFLVIDKITNIFPLYLFGYRYANLPFLPIIQKIIPGIVKAADIPYLSLPLLFLPLLYLPIICMVAYILGYKQFSIFERLTYKNTKKKKKR